MKTEISLELLKEFVDCVEKHGVKYIVIAGFGLDGRRGRLTRPHQDLDIVCAKEQEEEVFSVISELGYTVKDRFNDLLKLRRDTAKIDLCLCALEGEERVNYGRIAVTRFPAELFSGHRVSIEGVEFRIAPDPLLKKWGLDSKHDSEYAETIDTDKEIMKKIKREMRN